MSTLKARDALMVAMMKVMADERLDAIVHKTVEHQPTLIKDGVNPPYVSQKGVPALNTFLVFVPVISVPAGFTTDNLPAGITFMGRPYEDGTVIRLAYAYRAGHPSPASAADHTKARRRTLDRTSTSRRGQSLCGERHRRPVQPSQNCPHLWIGREQRRRETLAGDVDSGCEPVGCRRPRTNHRHVDKAVRARPGPRIYPDFFRLRGALR